MDGDHPLNWGSHPRSCAIYRTRSYACYAPFGSRFLKWIYVEVDTLIIPTYIRGPYIYPRSIYSMSIYAHLFEKMSLGIPCISFQISEHIWKLLYWLCSDIQWDPISNLSEKRCMRHPGSSNTLVLWKHKTGGGVPGTTCLKFNSPLFSGSQHFVSDLIQAPNFSPKVIYEMSEA